MCIRDSLQEIAHLIKVLRAMSNVCLGYGSSFPLVAVEKLRTGHAADGVRQFPCQIMGVLNACVEPKATRGRQAMSRITGQEDPPAAIGRGELGRHSPGSVSYTHLTLPTIQRV